MSISEKLSGWYDLHHRQLPWRHTKEPYRIWLSEIILQQTRVAQGQSYYERFIKMHPNIASLALASEQEILKLWQGLGYYSRARNMHSTAKIIYHTNKGQFPDTFSELKKLKGVGDYTAAAIASICFGKANAVVDGNVYRVLSRLFANPLSFYSSEGKKSYSHLANELLDVNDPGKHNQAMMELGALICLPRNPVCTSCPLQNDCKAYTDGIVSDLPVKSKPNKTRDRFFHYFFIVQNGKFLIGQRKSPGIWKNLYEFPVIEHDRLISYRRLQNHTILIELSDGIKLRQLSKPIEQIHILSHQRIHARLFMLSVIEGELKNRGEEYILVGFDELKDYPVHRLMELFVEHILSVSALD
ncbi:MAG: A/G-specific adenine glycosylase [Bacteroidales bacterium]|nr:A/G-specific adenine glycosylase [Bacteroidales bacterium]MCF8455952.1 A/G-specific adenine glycosylase [Bacteroidales bacterium]